MKTGPLTTETLVQLLTAARMPPDKRESAREAHRDEQPVTLVQQKDFTFTLEFENGDSLSLSYQEGNALMSSLKP